MSYVYAGYVLAFVALGGYAWRVLARQRALTRTLHPDEGSGR